MNENWRISITKFETRDYPLFMALYDDKLFLSNCVLE